MKSNEIEEIRGSIRPHCNSRASRRRAVNRRDCSRRCCAQRGRDRIHSDWPAGHRPRKNQATGNWRAKSDPVARDRVNRHAESAGTRVGTARCAVRTSQRDVPTINIGNALT